MYRKVLTQFKIKQASKPDTTTEYARGFVKKCTDRNVDPEKLIEIANTLELQLL